MGGEDFKLSLFTGILFEVSTAKHFFCHSNLFSFSKECF